MKLWVTKRSAVSIRDQLKAQVTLAIAGGDLSEGDKLPSIRTVARRFKIHQNTVANVYRELEEEGLLTLRRGSGAFVRSKQRSSRPLSSIVSSFLKTAAAEGYTEDDVRDYFRAAVRRGCSKVVVLDSDAGLREVLMEEIRTKLKIAVQGASPDDPFDPDPDACYAALSDEQPKLGRLAGGGSRLILLTANSVLDALASSMRPEEKDLIAVVSRWNDFLQIARIMFAAADLSEDRILVRRRHANWKRGLDAASIIVCDAATAKQLDQDERLRVFNIISPASMEEIAREVQSGR